MGCRAKRVSGFGTEPMVLGLQLCCLLPDPPTAAKRASFSREDIRELQHYMGVGGFIIRGGDC